jgi:hypothetical protein
VGSLVAAVSIVGLVFVLGAKWGYGRATRHALEMLSLLELQAERERSNAERRSDGEKAEVLRLTVIALGGARSFVEDTVGGPGKGK